MRLIKNPNQLEYPPRACAVTGRTDGDFIDFQKHFETFDGPMRLYLMRPIVEEAARLVGMVPGAEIEELQEQLAAYGAQLDQLKAEMAEMSAAYQFVSRVSNGEGI